jgi:hypothetical protein
MLAPWRMTGGPSQSGRIPTRLAAILIVLYGNSNLNKKILKNKERVKSGSEIETWSREW